MKFIYFLPSLLLMVTSLATDQRLYLSSSEGISVYSIDSSSGRLKEFQTIDLSGAWQFKFSSDNRHLYVGTKVKGDPEVVTLSRAGDGSLALVNRVSMGLLPNLFDLDRTGEYLASNIYGKGKSILMKLEDGVFRGDIVAVLNHEPKAHGVTFSPSNRWLLVPATLPNKVFVNTFDAKAGTMEPNSPPFANGPSGDGRTMHPRHLVFHPTLPNVLYTTQESKQPGVCVWNWDEQSGTLKPIHDIVTRPEGFDGQMSTSTLNFSPDGKYLYAVNRNKVGSTIVLFNVDPNTGHLSLKNMTPCETSPRSFCFDATGRFMYVVGQSDSRLGVYTINQETGAMIKLEQHVVPTIPIRVEAR